MVPKEKMIEFYEKMVLIRFFEEKAVELFLKGVLPGFIHSSIGQEAVSVGAVSALREDDYLASTHRGHGDIITKGARVDRMMAELFAKKTGYCKGKGGSMHIADLELGILGATGIVGGGLPIANGAALACQMKGTDQVCLVFFGDGASNQGFFHEALNLGSLWNLPVIYVCQNNFYAESTPQSQHQKIKDISIRGMAYDIPGVSVDGNDVVAVHEIVTEAVERARKRKGPSLIECKTYRHLGHYVGDPSTAYRTKEEIEGWKKRDPIRLHRENLLGSGICSEKDLQEIEGKATREVDQAVVFAMNSPEPELEDALEDIYVGPYIP